MSLLFFFFWICIIACFSKIIFSFNVSCILTSVANLFDSSFAGCSWVVVLRCVVSFAVDIQRNPKLKVFYCIKIIAGNLLSFHQNMCVYCGDGSSLSSNLSLLFWINVVYCKNWFMWSNKRREVKTKKKCTIKFSFSNLKNIISDL